MHPLFRGVPAELVNKFIAQASPHGYPKGRIIFMQEDEAERFYLLVSGWVKLFRETLDGEEAVIDVVDGGHLLGESVIFENDTYHCGAEVVEDAALVSMPLSLLKEAVETSTVMAKNLFTAMSRAKRLQTKELEHRTIQNAPQRIGCFLLRLIPKNTEKNIVLHLPYDKTLMAARLGMKPETFSRALNRLRDETGIRIRGASVEIDDVKMLSDYSCSACSSAYPCEE